MDEDPAEPPDRPEEIVMRRGWRGFRRVRHPMPAELRYVPLLYRVGFLWPLHPLTLVALVAVALAVAGGLTIALYTAAGADLLGALMHVLRP